MHLAVKITQTIRHNLSYVAREVTDFPNLTNQQCDGRGPLWNTTINDQVSLENPQSQVQGVGVIRVPLILP